MHQDLEKLINLAKESGELTEKQKEIILRKAKKLGEDVDEVEMILESEQVRAIVDTGTKSKGVIRKCPNCGAVVPASSISCPECGFELSEENNAITLAKKEIALLEHKLKEVDDNDIGGNALRYLLAFFTYGLVLLFPKASTRKKIDVINSFLMPATKEGLLLFFQFSFSQYRSYKGGFNDLNIISAWKAKTHQAMDMLYRYGDSDNSIQNMLVNYEREVARVDRKLSKVLVLLLGIVIFYTVIVVMAYL